MTNPDLDIEAGNIEGEDVSDLPPMMKSDNNDMLTDNLLPLSYTSPFPIPPTSPPSDDSAQHTTSTTSQPVSVCSQSFQFW